MRWPACCGLTFILGNFTVTESDNQGFVDVAQHLEYFKATQKHFGEMLQILQISSLPRGQATVLKRLYKREKENWLVMGPLGCGKTSILAVQIARAAYVHNEEGKEAFAAVALFPTRETAKATQTLLRALISDSEVRGLTAIGGEHSTKQLETFAAASKPHILIETPGKVLDLMKTTDALSFSSTRLFALDEADDLLSDSKLTDVRAIRSYLNALPTQVYASSFRAPLIKSFYDVASAQLKDVVNFLGDIFPELNLRKPLIIFCTTRVGTDAGYKQLLYICLCPFAET
ncbi:hypothetical protein KCU98_g9892, partial [Aureobasidium melanogenum]